jgi:hypothetical protein
MAIERGRKKRKELPEGMKRLLDRDRGGERQPQALATPPAVADVWAEFRNVLRRSE